MAILGPKAAGTIFKGVSPNLKKKPFTKKQAEAAKKGGGWWRPADGP